MQSLRKSLTSAQAKKLEAGGALSLAEAKRAFRTLLPKEAQIKLRAARTQQEADDLIDAYLGTKAVTFQVEETFRGEQFQIRQVRTGYGSGDCGYNFQLGQTYLVYAGDNPENGRMTTSACTRTMPATAATADLAYFRSVKSGSAVTKVYGYVFSNPRERIGLLRNGGLPSTPIRDAVVELESAGSTRTTTTDVQGAFSFEELPEGDYEIHARATGYSIEGSKSSFHLAPYACSMWYLAGQPVK